MLKFRLRALTDAIRWYVTRNVLVRGDYADYGSYVAHQKTKTTDPARIARLTDPNNWRKAVTHFIAGFEPHRRILPPGGKAICLGSRTGQEVAALRDLGLDAIGIDLVAFPPLTVEGDVHALDYPEASFDFAYSNIFDHVLYPDRFVAEIERVLRPGGHVLLHLYLGGKTDGFAANRIFNPAPVIQHFAASELISSEPYANPGCTHNWELVLRRLPHPRPS